MKREIDKSLLVRRFSRAIETYRREAVAQRQIADHMADMIAHHLPSACNRVLEVGCGTGFLTRRLLDTLHPRQLTLNDICRDMQTCFSDLLDNHRAVFMNGDAEKLEFPGDQDLIASCSVLQWFARPKGFLDKCHELLVPEGHIAFSTFGPDNLKEITTVTGNGLNYGTLNEWQQMLASRYDIVTVCEERIRLVFDTPQQVLRHLKQTGVTAVVRQAWTRGDLLRFSNEYTEQFAQENKVPLTYHPIYIIARKRT